MESSSRPGSLATPYPRNVHPLAQKLIERSPAPLRGPVTAAVRTADGVISNRLPGLAAEIAFWVLLSLPSLLLTAIAAASLVIEGQAWEAQLIDRVEEVASLALTNQTTESVVEILEQLLVGGGPGLVSFAFLVAVWTASRAVRVVLTTIAIVSRRGEPRRGWHDRLLGFVVTLGTLIVGGILAPLLVAGPNFGDQLVNWIGTDLEVIADIWRQAYWPTVILLATMALAVLYHLGIPGRSRWRHDWPGAVLATTVWLAGSTGLRIYGSWIVDGDSAYGPLAGPIVALLWLWLTGFAVLLGAQLNAQIERSWSASAEEQPKATPAAPSGQDETIVLEPGATYLSEASPDGRTPASAPESAPESEPDTAGTADERRGSRAFNDPPDVRRAHRN